MLARATGLKLMHVPYRGVAPSVVAALSGEVPLLFVALGGVSSQLKAGKLVPVAVAEPRRSSLLADVPTFTEAGVKGVEVHAWYGLFTPAGTPAAAVSELNRLVNEVLKLPEVRARFEGAGLELAGGSAQALASAVAADYDRYGRIARELHIRAD
jgi:tripartite-type tricarboxylate transporter receptor subunit TctC